MKQVQKLLNSPLSKPEVYNGDSLSNLYIGSPGADAINPKKPAGRYNDIPGAISPDQTLRISQARNFAEVIDELRVKIERFQHKISGVDFATSDIKDEERLRDQMIIVEILLHELRTGLIFTRAEKDAKWDEQVTCFPPPARLAGAAWNVSSTTLTAIQLKVTEFQAELRQRQRAVVKVERMVKDLGLNINDSRCAGILADQRRAEARLSKCVGDSVAFLAREFENIKTRLGAQG